MRFQVTFSGEPLMSDTSHTSPLHVETAAVLPSGRKSNPPKRMTALYGLLNGGSKVSTVYALSSFPMTALVSTVCFQSPAPPLVNMCRSTASVFLSDDRNAARFSFAPPQIESVKLIDTPCAGNIRRIAPSL